MTSVSTDLRQGVNAGAAIKVPCQAATTANITLSGEQTIDTVACVAGDRVLVANQTDTTENGIWIVAIGTWTRAIDFDGMFDVKNGTLVNVIDGTQEGLWRVNGTDPIQPSISNITFTHSGSMAAGAVLGWPITAPGVSPAWVWMRPDGTFVDQTGTTSMGFQEAYDYARANGYRLVANGQGNNTGGHGVQGAYIQADHIVFGPMQFYSVSLYNVDINCSPSDATKPGILADTSILFGLELDGQLTYSGNSSCLKIQPQNADPEDGGIFSADGMLRVRSITAVGGSPLANVEVDLTYGGVDEAEWVFPELNGNGLAQYNFVVRNPNGSGSAFLGNVVRIGHAHLATVGAIQEGTSTTNQGNLGRNVYICGALTPNGSNAIGWGTYGKGSIADMGFINNGEGALKYGVRFFTGSSHNQVRVGDISGAATAAFLDDAGAGAFNELSYNGLKYYNGSTYSPDLMVQNTRTVNGHALSSNVTVTASDVGAPSGSGSSTGTNTGDKPNVRCSVYLSSNQSLTGSMGRVNFDTVSVDSNSWWDSTNKRYTPQLAGTYRCTTLVTVNGTSVLGNMSGLDLRKNGTSVAEPLIQAFGILTNATLGFCIATKDISLNGSSDYIDVAAFSQSTTPVAAGGAIYTYLDIALVDI